MNDRMKGIPAEARGCPDDESPDLGPVEGPKAEVELATYSTYSKTLGDPS
ncbi:MAG: hypothetical protein FWD17_02240 [Polyangiaceae bacterium]|nr:hypothetical protein [Polyangiaceae bacterium]